MLFFVIFGEIKVVTTWNVLFFPHPNRIDLKEFTLRFSTSTRGALLGNGKVGVKSCHFFLCFWNVSGANIISTGSTPVYGGEPPLARCKLRVLPPGVRCFGLLVSFFVILFEY